MEDIVGFCFNFDTVQQQPQAVDEQYPMDRDLEVTWESLHERSNDPPHIQDERVLVEDQAQYPTSTQQFLEN